MLTHKTRWICLALWLTTLTVTFSAFLAGAISEPMGLLVSGTSTLLLGVVLRMMQLGEPTRSIAHVLYDAEHPVDRAR